MENIKNIKQRIDVELKGEKIKKEAESIGVAIKSYLYDWAEQHKITSTDVLSSVKDLANQSSDIMKSVYQGLVSVAKERTSEILSDTEDFYKNVTEQAKQAATSEIAEAKKVAEVIKNTAKEKLDDARDMAWLELEIAKENAIEIKKLAREKANDMVNNAKTVVKTAKENAKKIQDEAKVSEWVEVQYAKEKAREIIDVAKNKSKEIISIAREEVKNIKNKEREILINTELIGRTRIENAKNTARNIIENSRNRAREELNTVRSVKNEIINSEREKVKNVVDLNKNMFNNIKNGLINILGSAKTTAVGWVTVFIQAFSSIIGAFKSIVNTVKSIYKTVTGFIKNIINGITRVIKKVVELGRKIKQNIINSISSVQDAVDKTADALMKAGKQLSKYLTAPVTLFGGMATKAIMDFEEAISKVVAFSQASGGILNKLREQAKELGRTTKFTAVESAEGMSILALAGWKAKNILAMIPSVLDTAAAGLLGLEDATDIVASAVAMFNIRADRGSIIADILAKAATSSKTTMYNLGEALRYVGGKAAAMGASLYDVITSLAVMANYGIDGSMAGMSLNKMLVDLVKKAKDGAVAVGGKLVNVFDKGTEKVRNMIDIITDFVRALDGLTDKKRAEEILKVFDIRGARAMEVFFAAGIKSIREMEAAINDSTGAAKRMADTLLNNLAGDIVRLKSAWESLKISFGEMLDSPIRKMIQYITLLVNTVSKLSREQKLMIAGWALGLALIGPTLLGIGLIVKGVSMAIGVIKALVTAIFSFKVMMMGLLSVFLTIGAVIGAYSFIKPIVEKALMSLKAFSDETEKLKESIGSLTDGNNDFGSGWDTATESLEDYNDELKDVIKGHLSFDEVYQLGKDSSVNADFGIDDFDEDFDIIPVVADNLVDAADSLVGMLDNIPKSVGDLKELFKNIPVIGKIIDWTETEKGIKIIGKLRDAISNLGEPINNVKEAFKKVLGYIGKITDIWDIDKSVEENINNLVDKAIILFDWFVKIFEFPTTDTGRELFGSIGVALSSVLVLIKEFLLHLLKVTGIWDVDLTVKENLNNIVDKVKKLLNWITKVVQYPFSDDAAALMETLRQKYERFKDTIKEAWDILQKIFVFIGEKTGLWDFNKSFSENIDIMMDKIDGLISWFDEIGDRIADFREKYQLDWFNIYLYDTFKKLEEPLESLKNAFKDLSDALGKLAKSFGLNIEPSDTLLKIIRAPWVVSINLFVGALKSIIDTLTILVDWFARIIKGVNNFVDTISKAFEKIKNMMSITSNKTSTKTSNKNIDVNKAVAAFSSGAGGSTKDTATAAKSIISTISSYIGFNSPSEKGEGRNIVQWGENMVSGFLQGVSAKLVDVENMAGVMTRKLKPTDMNDFYGGEISSNIDNYYSSSNKENYGDIILKVGTLIADKEGIKKLGRMIKEVIDMEQGRVGGVFSEA